MKAAGKIGKISKDADFEKMFGKDIDEFLEDSEWDIESIDKMSQFSSLRDPRTPSEALPKLANSEALKSFIFRESRLQLNSMNKNTGTQQKAERNRKEEKRKVPSR